MIKINTMSDGVVNIQGNSIPMVSFSFLLHLSNIESLGGFFGIWVMIVFDVQRVPISRNPDYDVVSVPVQRR